MTARRPLRGVTTSGLERVRRRRARRRIHRSVEVHERGSNQTSLCKCRFTHRRNWLPTTREPLTAELHPCPR